MSNKRGRPKSAITLERERAETMLKNPPSHISLMTTREQEEINERLVAGKKIEDNLIKEYSPITPKKLIFELASFGDESMYGHEEIVLEKYEKLQDAETSGRLSGTRRTAEKAHARAKNFWDKNPDLFKAMGRPRNANTTAQRIIDNWITRGDGGNVPSINTIKNWYKSIKNSKGSLDIK